MEYNTKIIDYGDYIHIQHYLKGFKRVDFPDELQKALDDTEKVVIKNDGLTEVSKDPKQIEHCLSVSVNRSKNSLYRIARSNQWDYFCTLTFDRNGVFTEAIDSSDYNLCSSLVTKFFSGLKRKLPDLKYLVVPEFHKDGIHYHYHGLIGNAKGLDVIDTGRVDKLGSKIYDIDGWTFGFSNASKIKDQSAVRNYIGKYITKDLMNKLKYKKRYYCSQNVNICEEQYKFYTLDELYDLYGDRISFIKTISIDGLNRINYLEIKKDVDD